MGLLDYLSPALTTAAQVSSANTEGKKEGSALLRAILGQQAALDEKRAQTGKLFADTALSQHRNKAPVLGEDGYADAEGKVEQAKKVAGLSEPVIQGERKKIEILAPSQANAAAQKATALIQPGVDKIRAETPAAAAMAGAKADAEVPAKQKVQESGAGSASNNRMLAKDFRTSTKAITDEAPKYNQAKALLTEARTNPAATKSALLGFASVADQNAQLRQGIIKMIEQVDPSAGGRLDIFMGKLADGKYPANTLNQMEHVLDTVHQTHRQEYETRRAAHVARHPEQDGHVESADEIFGVSGAPASSGNVDFHAPVKGKTKNPFLP